MLETVEYRPCKRSTIKRPAILYDAIDATDFLPQPDSQGRPLHDETGLSNKGNNEETGKESSGEAEKKKTLYPQGTSLGRPACAPPSIHAFPIEGVKAIGRFHERIRQ
jgi:hypothetical protein